MRTARIAALLAATASASGCSVAKVPVKVGGTAVGTAILVVTRDDHRLP